MTSCSGLLMSTDFGIDDYGPADNWYWSPYSGYYNGPGGFFGPAWGPPSPPVIAVPPQSAAPRPPMNGANRPNFVPSRPSSSQPPVSAPPGTQRPGNMGQPVQTPQPSIPTPSVPSAPSQGSGTNMSGSSGVHRGR